MKTITLACIQRESVFIAMDTYNMCNLSCESVCIKGYMVKLIDTRLFLAYDACRLMRLCSELDRERDNA